MKRVWDGAAHGPKPLEGAWFVDTIIVGEGASGVTHGEFHSVVSYALRKSCQVADNRKSMP